MTRPWPIASSLTPSHCIAAFSVDWLNILKINRLSGRQGSAWHKTTSLPFPLESLTRTADRTLTLEDGSTVELDSGSRIRIAYGGHERQVELLDGQALFRVAHDLTRPFIVHTRATNIQAIGTQFDVYKKDTGTIVTVVEGRVAVIRQGPVQLGGDGLLLSH
jgi:ferric-dicitrate binding protein FerR (iron transport regulator)